MPIWKEIQQTCAYCQGTGRIIPSYNTAQPPPVDIECPVCAGEGYLEWGRLKDA